MAAIQRLTLTWGLEIEVEFIIEPAEADIGHPRSVDIISVSINGTDIRLPKSALDDIKEEILESTRE